SRAREETHESRGMPCLFLNTERGFGGKPPQKSGFRRHLAGSEMPKETFFTAISRWRVVSRRALDASGFWQGVTAVGRPRSSATPTMQLYFRHRYLVPPGDGVLRKAVQAERHLTPVPCSSTSKRSPLASTNLVCISGIQHIDLIRQYRGDLLIN